jgi:O-antigen ligase
VAIQPRDLPGANGPAPSAPGRPARRTFAPPSPAAFAISLYTFLVISRLPEMVPGLHLLRPILVVAIIAIALAAMLPAASAVRLLKSTEAYAVLGLLTLVVVTIPTSYWPGGAVGFLISGYSKTVTFFFLLLYCIRTLREFKRLIWAFVGAIGALELAVLLGKVQGRVQVTSTYDPNDLAFVMVCVLPVALSLWVVARGVARWILPGLILLALVTTIMTKSRGGFITLLVVAPLILLRLPSRVPFLRVGILVVGIAFFAVIAPQSYWDRITTIWDSESRGDGYLEGGLQAARWEVWKKGAAIMMTHPLLGVGAGGFVLAEGATHKTGKWMAPHNSYIQIGAELGLSGLALFAFLLYRTIKNYRQVIRLTRRDGRLQYHYRLANGLEVAVYAYMIGAIALSQAYSEIFYFLVAASVLLRHVALRAVARGAADGRGTAVSGSTVPWWKAAR